MFQIATVKDYDGDKSKLGNAEKFFLTLSGLAAFKLRIDGLVLKDDFKLSCDSLRPNIETYIRACEHPLDNESFKVFLRFVLHTGNFLNAVSDHYKVLFPCYRFLNTTTKNTSFCTKTICRTDKNLKDGNNRIKYNK